MKKIILLLICIICIYPTYASTPDYDVYYDIQNTINESDIGNIVISKQSYIPEDYEISNYSNWEVQKYDRIYWRGSNTIEIKDPDQQSQIITPDNSYYFTKTGEHRYSNINNQSQNGTINILVENPLKVNVEYWLDNQEKTINQYSITDEKIININVDNNLPPKNYILYIKTNKTEESFNLNLPENSNFVIEEQLDDNLTIKAGEIKDIGKIILKNRGNTNFYVENLKSGNGSDFIVMSSNITLIKGVEVPLPIIAQVPLKTETGQYQTKIRFLTEDKLLDTNITINVKDYQDPEILNITFEHYDMHLNNEVEIKTTDNIGVKKAILQYNNLSIELEKDNYIFYKDLNFYNDSINFTVCIWDLSDNQVCENINKTFNKLNLLNQTKNIELPTKKIKTTTSETLFNKSYDVKLNITLERLDFENNISFPMIRIRDEADNYYNFNDINDTITISDKTKYYLDIKYGNITEYEGVLSLKSKDYVEDIKNINFKGKFNYYEVPPNTFNLEKQDINVTCYTTDTGDPDTSYIECPYRMPLNSYYNSMPILITTDQVELYEDKINLTLENQKQKIRSKNNFIAGIFGVLFGLIMYSVYIVYIFPNFRWRF